MRRVVFAVPGRLDARTGGSIYDRRMVESLRARGWSIDVLALDGAFPTPGADDAERARQAFQSLADGSLVVADGLLFSALPRILRTVQHLLFVPVIHLPLECEFGLPPEEARRRRAGECDALASAAHVIVTGSSTREIVIGYGVPRENVTCIAPGTDKAAVAAGSGESSPHLVCVAAFTPGKGYDVLAAALNANRTHRWRVTCVGATDRRTTTAPDFCRAVRAMGVNDRVTVAGEIDHRDVNALLDRADLFVLPTRHETFGMAVAEAIARGLPVVSTRTGEIPDIVGDGGALAEPGDAQGFSDVLAGVLGDASRRERLREAAVRARDCLQTWESAATRMAALLEQVAR